VPTYFGSNHYTIAQDLSWRGKSRGYPAGDHSLSAAAARTRSATGRQEERSAMNEEPTHKQHRQASKVLHERCPDLPRSLAGVMAAFFALLGVLALFSAILRH